MAALAFGGLLGSLAISGGAKAQDALSDDPSGATAFAAFAIAKLNLSLEQQAALLEFEALDADPQQAIPITPEAFRAMSLPQRLDFEADQAAYFAPKIRAVAGAARRFYALLSVDQRKAFDTILYPFYPSLAPPAKLPTVPAPMNFKLPGRTNPDWLVRPSVDALQRVFPRAAQRGHVSGRAVLHCIVDAGGLLTDCTVIEETPKNAGFGNAALEMTAYMRMKPATQFGAPIESSVNVPVTFKVEDFAASAR
jgi:TonB family protein